MRFLFQYDKNAYIYGAKPFSTVYEQVKHMYMYIEL